MNRKLIYFFTLLVFFLMWGVFGFAAAMPRSEPSPEATSQPVVETLTVPSADDELSPVTGETRQGAGARVVYVLFAYGALIVILALLDAANKTTTAYIHHKDPPDQS